MEQFKRGRDFAAWLGLPPRLLNAGDLVKVTGGPFAELIGRVESIVPERRIWVLLDLMQRTTRVALASSVLRVV